MCGWMAWIFGFVKIWLFWASNRTRIDVFLFPSHGPPLHFWNFWNFASIPWIHYSGSFFFLPNSRWKAISNSDSSHQKDRNRILPNSNWRSWVFGHETSCHFDRTVAETTRFPAIFGRWGNHVTANARTILTRDSEIRQYTVRKGGGGDSPIPDLKLWWSDHNWLTTRWE